MRSIASRQRRGYSQGIRRVLAGVRKGGESGRQLLRKKFSSLPFMPSGLERNGGSEREYRRVNMAPEARLSEKREPEQNANCEVASRAKKKRSWRGRQSASPDLLSAPCQQASSQITPYAYALAIYELHILWR